MLESLEIPVSRTDGRARGRRPRLCVFLAAACCLLLAGCQTQLYGNLEEKEANAVLAALKEAAIQAEKRPGEEGTFSVFVEEEDFARAMRILEALALPSRQYDDLGTVFGKGAMFSTPLEEKARYLYAMQEDLAKTIAAIDGVLIARVHLVLPEQDQLGRDLHAPSAAVFVRHVDDERHDPIGHRVEIRRLVAAGIPNLDEEHIVVTFFPAQAGEAPAAPVPVFRHILGVRIAEESADRVRMGLAAIVAFLVIIGVLCALALRKRKGAE